jgi:hypothetical protein
MLLVTVRLSAQNLDIGYYYSSGPYRGMAGSGIGIADCMSAFDLNPAGPAGNISNVTASLSQSLTRIAYSLFRNNQDPKTSTHSNSSIIFDWNHHAYQINGLLLGIPVTSRIPLTLGFVTRIAPLIRNTCRATTWSDLFDQSTSGSVGAFILSSAVPVTKSLSLGMTLYLHSGTITSEVRGQNHGNDKDKWAILKSRFSGVNLKGGILYQNSRFGMGLTVETPHSMKVTAEKKTSPNDLYGTLLPTYEKTVWKMPLMLGLGFAFKGINGCLLTFDFESRRYRESDVQFNLYEFGAPPQWEPVSIIRTGIEYHPFPSSRIPMRLGYARIPQLYRSNHSIGREQVIVEHQNTIQNIKHLFTFGSSFSWHQVEIDAGIEFSSLKWHRDLDTRFFIRDDYTERRVTLYSQFSLMMLKNH